MKKKFTPIIIACFLLISVTNSFSQTLIHYWHFNNFTTANPIQDVVANPIAPLTADYTIVSTPSPQVSYTVLPGTASPYNTYWDYLASTNTGTSNAQTINGTLTPAGNVLRPRNPSDKMQILFKVPTTGYQSIAMAFDYQISSVASGPNSIIIDYSTDGGTTFVTSGLSIITYVGATPITTSTVPFDVTSTASSLATNWNTLKFTITNTAAENNPNLVIRVKHGTPNSGTSGNVRYDNVTITGTPITLPVTLLAFNAIKNNGKTQLVWNTTNELNMQSYNVESSTDGTNFNFIASVVPANTASLNSYSYTDTKSSAAITYYHLKMVDNNGSYTYSNIISVNSATLTSKPLSVYPNPVVNGTLQLMHEITLANASIDIYSANGTLVTSYPVAAGMIVSNIAINSFSSGTYIAILKNNGSNSSVRFYKK
jgi:hypothetical protein